MPNSLSSPDLTAARTDARSPKTKKVQVPQGNVDITVPCPSPQDWRDQWIYFLIVDRFNNPGAAPRLAPWDGEQNQFQGGTFNGIRAQLEYLQDLGVGAIWLSPVLKNCQYAPFTYHGYGIQDFLTVEPRFGSTPKKAEQELRALVDEAHVLGMYVIFDIVLNHAGDVFEYVFPDGTTGSGANFQNQEYPIRWRDDQGKGRPDWTQVPINPKPDAAVWPQELQRKDFFRCKGKGGEDGGDFESLKELVTDRTGTRLPNLSNFPVRSILISAYQYIIAKFDIDGFRIDTLKYIEPDFERLFGNAVREFALSIGKKNFLTFGEVYDNEQQIARFVGRNTTAVNDAIGVDAALDFPLFFRLPAMAKGLSNSPQAIVDVFEERKRVQQNVLSSHGEASKFFVTFLDNHDQKNRFRYVDPAQPGKFDDQLTLALGCLFTLQGIPCVYYGTEQGLHGAGGADSAVREALWGKPNAFNQTDASYLALSRLASTRQQLPALRYGRQYFRPISGDGVRFGISTDAPGVLAFSRILDDQEVIIVANTNTNTGWGDHIIVDSALNAPHDQLKVLYSNKPAPKSPQRVILRNQGSVQIREVDGAVTDGPVLTVQVQLQPMEIQILGK